MQVNNIVRVIWLFLIVFAGCVDPFTPTIKERQNLLVIDGQLTHLEGYQYIRISRSTPYNNPWFDPELNCHVAVYDDLGNIYRFDESGPGIYSLWMPAGTITPDRKYKLSVVTWEDKLYESDYDMLAAYCPEIDTVYYEMDTRGTSDPDQPMDGIQFYVDVDSIDDQNRKLLWELTETWEYWAGYPIQYYYHGGSVHIMSDPLQYYRCWRTEPISEIFTINTEQLTTTRITKFPLHFVSERSNRLKIKYSLLIRLHSLSDNAFNYWSNLKAQNQETGGLYEKQPPQVTGNIHSVNDPDERVLGNFSISYITEKRIFVDEQFPFDYPGHGCRLDTVTVFQLRDLHGPYPIYMISLNPMGSGPPYGVGDGICFDCREAGGTTTQPSFWK